MRNRFKEFVSTICPESRNGGIRGVIDTLVYEDDEIIPGDDEEPL